MPCVNIGITARGAMVEVVIGITDQRAKALQKAGQWPYVEEIGPPLFVQGNFLVDTGATMTCVDSALIHQLHIEPSGVVLMQTPSTNGQGVHCFQYDVKLLLPSQDTDTMGLFVDAMPVIETSFSNQGIDGLIGRDILDQCLMVYNGKSGQMTIAF